MNERYQYEDPTTFYGDPVKDGELLPVLGGPLDGASIPVPAMFGRIVPTFVRVGMHFYQLIGADRLWRFSFTASKAW